MILKSPQCLEVLLCGVVDVNDPLRLRNGRRRVGAVRREGNVAAIVRAGRHPARLRLVVLEGDNIVVVVDQVSPSKFHSVLRLTKS